MSESKLQNIRQIIQSWRDRAKQLDENSEWSHALSVATALEDCAEQIEILIGKNEPETECLHPNCTCDDYCIGDYPYSTPTFKIKSPGEGCGSTQDGGYECVCGQCTVNA